MVRAVSTEEDANLAPALSKVFIRGFGRTRRGALRPRVTPIPSLSDLNASIRCGICHRQHGVAMPRCCVCPLCTTWVCAQHVSATPLRLYPNGVCQLQDYVGGAKPGDESLLRKSKLDRSHPRVCVFSAGSSSWNYAVSGTCMS